MLALVIGSLAPVLIWVGLFVAIRHPLVRMLKQAGVYSIVLLAGVSVPILIWIGLVVALREQSQQRRLFRLPSRTIAEIMGAAGLSVQRVTLAEETVGNVMFAPRSMAEVHEIFVRAGL